MRSNLKESKLRLEKSLKKRQTEHRKIQRVRNLIDNELDADQSHGYAARRKRLARLKAEHRRLMKEDVLFAAGVSNLGFTKAVKGDNVDDIHIWMSQMGRDLFFYREVYGFPSKRVSSASSKVAAPRKRLSRKRGTQPSHPRGASGDPGAR